MNIVQPTVLQSCVMLHSLVVDILRHTVLQYPSVLQCTLRATLCRSVVVCSSEHGASRSNDQAFAPRASHIATHHKTLRLRASHHGFEGFGFQNLCGFQNVWWLDGMCRKRGGERYGE